MHSAKVNENTSKTHTNTSEVSDQQTASPNDESAKRSHVKKIKQNWRINLLAMPKDARGKYTYPQDVFDSGVAPGALKCELPDRIEHMSRPQIRTLVVNKRQYQPLHKEYEERMDNRIESSWNSMYNTYKKQRRDLSRKSSTTSKRSRGSRGGSRGSKSVGKPAKDQKAGKSSSGKDKGGKGDAKKAKDKKGKKQEKEQKSVEKTDEEIEKELEEWCELRAKPKKIFPPEPMPRGPIADLIEMHDKMIELATPKKVHAIETKDPCSKIPEAALTYNPTDRILELAKPSSWRTTKDEPYIPGSVKPEALHAIATERVKTLATPKVTQNAKDSDVKEDPFAISPNALKYVATERIKELAQPISR